MYSHFHFILSLMCQDLIITLVQVFVYVKTGEEYPSPSLTLFQDVL